MTAQSTTETIPDTVLALLDNLFFVAKLSAAATQAGLRLSTSRTLEKALAIARTARPVVIVIDLDASGCQPFEFIHQLKADDELQALPLLGFVAHVNTGIQEQARQAGCDRVLARSVFSRDLLALLKAVGAAERSYSDGKLTQGKS